MSSPIWEGTRAGSAFSSRDVDILSETILVRIDKDFKTARFIVEYTVRSGVAGRQVPLLFLAQDYRDSFQVWVDNRPVALSALPEPAAGNTSPGIFPGAFETGSESPTVTVRWDKSTGYVYPASDLKYFEADLEKGTHKVRVEYTAGVWTDRSGWIRKYSFRYSLTPAKYWKSFGSLQVVVEQTGRCRSLVTNLGTPQEKKIGVQNTWTFQQLPGDYLEISYTPETGPVAQALLAVGPAGLALAFGLLLFGLHLFAASLYRKQHPGRKYSPVVIAGSLLIPLLFLLGYIYAFDLIDNAIGEDAGRHHGYVSLVLFLYPLIVPIYWTVMWVIDRSHKRRLNIG